MRWFVFLVLTFCLSGTPATACSVDGLTSDESKATGEATIQTDFETLFAENALFGLDAMISLAEFQNERSFEIDLQAGVFLIGEDEVPLSALGTWAAAPTNSWLWVWANPGWQGLPEEVTSAGELLKRVGEDCNISEFTTAELPTSADSFDEIGFQFAAIAAGLTGADGAMQYQHSGGSAFFIMPDLPAGTSDGPSRHIRVIMQGLGAYDLPHRLAISSYLRQKGYQIAEPREDLMTASRGESVLEISFDELGRLINIEGQIDG